MVIVHLGRHVGGWAFHRDDLRKIRAHWPRPPSLPCSPMPAGWGWKALSAAVAPAERPETWPTPAIDRW